MALARHGFTDIRILERAPSAEYYNPGKALAYALFATGKNTLRRLGMTDVDDLGVTKQGSAIDFRMLPDGRQRPVKSMVRPGKSFDKEAAITMFSRSGLNATLYNHVASDYSEHVRVHFSSKVVQVTVPTEAGEFVQVTTQQEPHGGSLAHHEAAAASPSTYRCRLLVGADGLHSRIRATLESAQPAGDWALRGKPGWSTGMRFKALTLPPNPKLSDAIGVLRNERGASFSNKPGRGQLPLRLTFFPLKDPTAPRAAIISMRPTHPLLALRTTEELYAYLERSLPQITRFRKLIPEHVAAAFIAEPAGVFPSLEACDRMFTAFEDAGPVAVAPGDAAAKIKGAAVMVIGDAAHRFPPDLGQGANAAMLDVWTLCDCLDEHGDDFAAAAYAWQEVRVKETRALLRMTEFGAPFQYSQSGVVLPKLLWTANFVLRMMLSKVLPFAISPPAALQLLSSGPDVRNPKAYNTLYRGIMRRADRTTTALLVVLAVLVMLAASAWQRYS